LLSKRKGEDRIVKRYIFAFSMPCISIRGTKAILKGVVVVVLILLVLVQVLNQRTVARSFESFLEKSKEYNDSEGELKRLVEELRHENKALKMSQSSPAKPIKNKKDNVTTDQPSIAEIMQRTGTDKYSTHHYDRSYSRWLAPFRSKKDVKFLEIGADSGKSMALWVDYFDTPELVLGLAYGKDAAGVDNKVDSQGFARQNQDKLKIMWGDQSKEETMDALCGNGPFDIIVDDGSHVPSHVIFSMVHLLPCLVPGGLYIIEDVETSYWDKGPSLFGYDFPGVGIGASPRYSAIEKLKQLIDVINRNEICRDDLSVLPGDENICEVSFSSNLIKFQKCTDQEMAVRKYSCLQWKTGVVHQDKVDEWMRNARETNSDFNIYAPEEPRNVSIFYNIFITQNNSQQALHIVEEQLDFRRTSTLANSTLYYTHIGNLTPKMPDCRPCKRLGAYKEGAENLTLQALYHHCLAHPSELVVYIHNKGSYTRTDSNDRLRRTLTKAVFSSQCVMMPHGSGCDTCSARFTPFPLAASPGNMFVAECSYVNTLMAPNDFGKSKEKLMREVMARNENDTAFQETHRWYWQVQRPSWVGTKRFAMEQWVQSHPSVQPCDVIPGNLWGGHYKGAPSDLSWIPNRQPVPRIDFSDSIPAHPWFHLKWRLHEWRYHYGSEPPSNNWVWKVYDKSSLEQSN